MTEVVEKKACYVNRKPKTLLASMVLGMIGQTLTRPKPKRMREAVKNIAPKMAGRIVGSSPIPPIDKSSNDDSFRQRMKSEKIRRKRFKTRLMSH